jgi:hypothetical protein
MAKQIIVLDVSKPNASDINVHWVFWLYPAAGREVPLPNATSLWRGAQPADITALQAGTVVEEPDAVQYPAGSTKVQIEADLVARYNARAAAFAAKQNPNQFYGVFFDSATGWSS